MTLLDTADVYGDGRSEERIRKAARAPVERPFVATKAGRRADPFEAAPVHAGEPAGLDRPVPPQPRRRDPRPGAAALPAAGGLLRRPRLRHPGRAGRRQAIAAYGVSVETVAEGLTALQHPGVQTLQVILNVFRRKPLEELLPAAPASRCRRSSPACRWPAACSPASTTSRRRSRPTTTGTSTGNGEAFDVGETFAGVPFDVGRRRGPRGRRDRRRHRARPRPSRCAG